MIYTQSYAVGPIGRWTVCVRAKMGWKGGRLEVTEVGTGAAESAGHCCILGSCVGSAYMGGQPRSIASGRSS